MTQGWNLASWCDNDEQISGMGEVQGALKLNVCQLLAVKDCNAACLWEDKSRSQPGGEYKQMLSGRWDERRRAGADLIVQ